MDMHPFAALPAKSLRFMLPLFFLLATIHLQAQADWPNYCNDPGGMRYSSLSQINRDNVARLKVAWVFHTGDISDGSDPEQQPIGEPTFTEIVQESGCGKC